MRFTHEIHETDDRAAGEAPRTIEASIDCGPRAIMIGFAGYGEKNAIEGRGAPVLIEFHGGRPRLLVWGDINSESPTHTIDLAGAAESARQEGRADEFLMAGRVDAEKRRGQVAHSDCMIDSPRSTLDRDQRNRTAEARDA